MYYFLSSSLLAHYQMSMSLQLWTLTDCSPVYFKHFCWFAQINITIWHFYSNFSPPTNFSKELSCDKLSSQLHGHIMLVWSDFEDHVSRDNICSCCPSHATRWTVKFVSISSSQITKQLFQSFLCNSQLFPLDAVDDPMSCWLRPSASGNSSSGHLQHLGGNSFDCCTERY